MLAGELVLISNDQAARANQKSALGRGFAAWIGQISKRVRNKNTKTIPTQSTNTGPKNWVFKLGLQLGLEPHGGLDFFRKIIILSTSPPIDGPAQSFLALGQIKNPFRKHKPSALRPGQGKIINLKGRHNWRGLKSRFWWKIRFLEIF